MCVGPIEGRLGDTGGSYIPALATVLPIENFAADSRVNSRSQSTLQERHRSQRGNFSLALAKGEGVKEYDVQSGSAAEIARLWLAVERSVAAINGAGHKSAMHRVAA
jgi:hypothetical protein